MARSCRRPSRRPPRTCWIASRRRAPRSKRNDHAGARAICDDVLREAPDHPYALDLRAQVEAASGNVAAALRTLLAAVDALPRHTLPPALAFGVWSTLERDVHARAVAPRRGVARRARALQRVAGGALDALTWAQDATVVLVLGPSTSADAAAAALQSITSQTRPPSQLVVSVVTDSPAARFVRARLDLHHDRGTLPRGTCGDDRGGVEPWCCGGDVHVGRDPRAARALRAPAPCDARRSCGEQERAIRMGRRHVRAHGRRSRRRTRSRVVAHRRRADFRGQGRLPGARADRAMVAAAWRRRARVRARAARGARWIPSAARTRGMGLLPSRAAGRASPCGRLRRRIVMRSRAATTCLPLRANRSSLRCFANSTREPRNRNPPRRIRSRRRSPYGARATCGACSRSGTC